VAEDLKLTEGLSRADAYTELIPQIEGLVSQETDLIANLANIAAALKETFDFLWIGFYIVKGNELVLGPFQGPVACTRIKPGKGVCGTAWSEKKAILVPDVDVFPGHIACSSHAKSEIVVPGIIGDKVKLILDVDSEHLNDFTAVDEKFLTDIMHIIEQKIV
jgi:L-methionine (R)-S-oxide reductase